MDQREATDFRGIPVTTVPRTLVDLAAVLDLDDLARACHEAGVKYGTTPADVEAVLARRPNSPGAAKLQAVLAAMCVSRSACSSGAFLTASGETVCRCPAPTGRPEGAAWTAAGLSTG